MRLPPILALLISLMAQGTPARSAARPQPPQADTAIARIRREVAAVHAELPRCARRRLDVFGLSAEGGEMDVYRCGGSIRRITVTFYGETGQASEEWYLAGERPFFVYRVDVRYERPFGRVARREEQRVYLRGDRLLRWLGPDGRPRPTASAEARGRLRELTERIDELLDRARTGRTDAK
ncbi:MAG TPA: hypothetical protein VF541_20225 [Longimicrobium sp.]|jgi:hypothetical protein